MLLGDIIRLNGRKFPEKVAIISGERTTTFGELNDRVLKVANAMLDIARPGDRIAVLAENITEYVEMYYGVPSAGMALTFLNVMVVDEQMEACPPGVVGEIVIRGEQVLKGYFGNEDGTAKAFEHGWFYTGDMARRDDEGYFYIVDRMKDMIITGGENVYSREVEEVLYMHPSVFEAAVVGLPDPVWGENVTAVVVLCPGMTATEAEIIASARDRLAGFKKPKRVIFLDELPKTVSGKIIKRELRDRFATNGNE